MTVSCRARGTVSRHFIRYWRTAGSFPQNNSTRSAATARPSSVTRPAAYPASSCTPATGHGLAVAAGMALAGRLDGRHVSAVFVLMGDGELDEAPCGKPRWPQCVTASIISPPSSTGTGWKSPGRRRSCRWSRWRTSSVHFGYAVAKVDGHDGRALGISVAVPLEPGRPTLILAHTIKGKGVSFIEHAASWHHRVPTDVDARWLRAELDQARAELQGVDMETGRPNVEVFAETLQIRARGPRCWS